jgi:uncharacterized protein YutE (UPF0331/DUF86 family)
MSNVIRKEAIMPRIDGINRDIAKLRELAEYSVDDLKKDEDRFALVQHYLRQALEGIFHIGEHILARLNGGRATDYKEIARKLGEHGVVEKAFADDALVQMAGYRNRLTHFYADITPEESHELITNRLDDLEIVLAGVRQVMEEPERFGVEVE